MLMERILDAMQRKRQAMGLGGENDSTSNAYAASGLNLNSPTWAETMARWKTASSSSDSLDEEVENVRSDMYAALDDVLEAAMQRRRLALSRT